MQMTKELRTITLSKRQFTSLSDYCSGNNITLLTRPAWLGKIIMDGWYALPHAKLMEKVK